MMIRKLLCPLRGHPQFLWHPQVGCIYVGGVSVDNQKVQFSCSCGKYRTSIHNVGQTKVGAT